MSSSPDVKEIAHYRFSTQKKGKEFIYEIKLVSFQATGEYRVLRRWYYPEEKKPNWRAGPWGSKEEILFDRKIVQKRDIMKYKVDKSIDIRKK